MGFVGRPFFGVGRRDLRLATTRLHPEAKGTPHEADKRTRRNMTRVESRWTDEEMR